GEVTRHLEADALLMQFTRLAPQREQALQERHLLGRTTPGLGLKANSVRYSTPCLRHYATVRRTASTPALMAGQTWQVLPLGPPTVAVHDDRDVPRNRAGRG